MKFSVITERRANRLAAGSHHQNSNVAQFSSVLCIWDPSGPYPDKWPTNGHAMF